MAPEVEPAQESIVLASFESRHAAEHMVASLGRGFRKKHAVTSRAADRGIESWEGSRTEFLADLDPGSKHDCVRDALGEPSKPD